MFNDCESSGKHMICDFKDVKNIEMLNSCKMLSNLLSEICSKYDFYILNKVEHIFEPIGCSIIFLLSESHISIHTFPEKQHISFDIYTCRKYKDNRVYNEIYDFLSEKLDSSSESTCNIIDRYF
jgi:S-adenosylmethionine decarboxylase proenzyme